jgi:NTP pyrophosphatase (non-canonical NTP hydrolase)
MSDIKSLSKQVVSFRNKRNWKQFHNPKDLAISLSLEASELLEHFQWKNVDEMENYIKTNKKEIGKELADVLYWVLLIQNDLKIDLVKVFSEKMKENELKYPVKKSKGKYTKYNKL